MREGLSMLLRSAFSPLQISLSPDDLQLTWVPQTRPVTKHVIVAPQDKDAAQPSMWWTSVLHMNMHHGSLTQKVFPALSHYSLETRAWSFQKFRNVNGKLLSKHVGFWRS